MQASRPPITPDDEDFEERAAIIEFLGNLPRAEAERLAREQQRQRQIAPLLVGLPTRKKTA